MDGLPPRCRKREVKKLSLFDPVDFVFFINQYFLKVLLPGDWTIVREEHVFAPYAYKVSLKKGMTSG